MEVHFILAPIVTTKINLARDYIIPLVKIVMNRTHPVTITEDFQIGIPASG
jgi:hypothetical protein